MGSDSGTSIPTTRDHSVDGSDGTDPFSFDMDDLTSESNSRRSFPSIRFTQSDSAEESSESDELDDDDPFLPEELRGQTPMKGKSPSPGAPPVSRILYIQMVRTTLLDAVEIVENNPRNTLNAKLCKRSVYRSLAVVYKLT